MANKLSTRYWPDSERQPRWAEAIGSTPYSLGEWIRLRRLEAVNRGLHDPYCHLSIGELAMHWGFSDQAQFTRSFRQHFGRTAREVRAGLNAEK